MQIVIPLSRQQREFLNDPHPIKVFIGGRRVGKSYVAKAAILKAGTEAPGRSCCVMPIQSQCNQFFEEFYTDTTFNVDGFTFDDLLESEPKRWPQPQMVFADTRHRCTWNSFEKPKRLRGGNWTGVVVTDEANDLKGDDLSKVIFPKLLDTKGQCIITSSISTHNWLWDLYLQGQKPNRMVKSWKVPTPEGPAFQGVGGKQRLEDFKSFFPDWIWRSECLCEPSADNTALFPYLDQCLNKDAVESRPIEGERYVAGLDLGRVADPEELCIVSESGRVVFWESFDKGLTHAAMAQRVGARCRFWKARCVIDATGAGGAGGMRGEADSHVKEYKAQLPEDYCIPFYWSGNSDSKNKRDVISNLSLRTERQQLSINEDKFPKLIEQMRRYRLIVKNGKVNGFGCVEGHDDCVAALAQAAWGIKEGWFSSEDGIALGYAT